MKYVCLVYLDEATFEPMSEAEKQRLINEVLDNDEALRASGNYVYADALAAARPRPSRSGCATASCRRRTGRSRRPRST